MYCTEFRREKQVASSMSVVAPARKFVNLLIRLGTPKVRHVRICKYKIIYLLKTLTTMNRTTEFPS